MKAELLYRLKDVLPNGDIIEIVIWEVSEAVRSSEHFYKYSLVFISNGKRVVGFDNERGKGDHCHLDGEEKKYSFSSVEKLIEDFISEVDKRR